MVVPDKQDFIAQLEFSLDNALGNLEHAVMKRRHGVDQCFFAIANRLESPLNNCRKLVDWFIGSLGRLDGQLQRQKEFVLGAQRLFSNVNPRRVLSRGYSIARDSAGRIIRSASQVDAGDMVVIELSQGELQTEVVDEKNKHRKQATLFSSPS
jgi:exonuclease VII large subunit